MTADIVHRLRYPSNMRALAFLCIMTGAICLTGCRPKLTCEKFSVEGGERRGFSGFNHPSDTATWSGCSDGKTRSLRCTTAHWSNWKCFCSIDKAEKLQARAEKTFPEDRAGATLFANKTCDWRIE